MSIYLATSTIGLLLINSIYLILNRFTLNVYRPISGYGCALIFALSLMFIGPMGSIENTETFSTLGFGNFHHIIIGLMLTITLILLISMKPSSLSESAILVAFSTLGLILMIETAHLIGFYLGVELYSLSAYILASGAGSLKSDNPLKHGVHVAPSVSAGLKYFLLSALSSGLLVGGISIIYASTGELTISGISRMLTIMHSNMHLTSEMYNNSILVILGISLVIGTLAFKIGSAPFHFWVPDVYSKVSLFVNFYLISVPKIGILFTLIKISLFLPVTHNLIMVFSILSLLVGAIGGLVQQKITRLLAYSSISHVGYILLALYGTHLKNTDLSRAQNAQDLVYGLTNGGASFHIYSLGLYLIIYSVMTLTFFSVLTLLRNKYSKITNEPYVFLSSLKNLSYVAPYLAGSLAITTLSMAGVPPLSGFIAKLYVYISVLDNNGIFLSVFAVLCSVVSAVYYLRIIKISYFYNTGKDLTKTPEISNFSSLVISFSTLFLVFYPILNPNIIYLIFI